MTPKQFINELFGEGWTNAQLSSYLDVIKRFAEDSQRYYVVRDFAKNIKLMENPVSNEERQRTDDIVDAKRYAHDPDEN